MNIEETKDYVEYLKSEKWRQLSLKRMEIDKNRCCMCGCTGTRQNPLETHHMSYKHLYHEEGRVYEDLITLCHCCHKALHRCMERVTNPDGRRGWLDNPRVPNIHCYNINGTIEYKQGGIEK